MVRNLLILITLLHMIYDASGQSVFQLDTSMVQINLIPNDSAERVMCVIPSDKGNWLLCYSRENERHGDVKLYLVNNEGTVIKSRNLGVPGFDFAFSGIETSDDHLLLAGFTNYKSAGQLDAYVMKVDHEGDTAWTTRIGGAGDDRVIRVIETSRQTYAAIGQTTSWGNGNIDGFLVELNQGGEVLSNVPLGDSLLNRTYSIGENADGYIISGITNANYPDNSDILLMGVQNDNVLWQKQWGGPQGDISHSMIPKPDGTWVSVGYSAQESVSYSDPLLLRFDHNGEILDEVLLQTGKEVRLMEGAFCGEHDLLAVGYMKEPTATYWDMAILMYNFQSSEYSIYQSGLGERDDELFYITIIGNQAIAAGYTNNTSHGNSNVLLLKFDVARLKVDK